MLVFFFEEAKMKLYTNHRHVSSAQGVSTETVKVYKLITSCSHKQKTTLHAQTDKRANKPTMDT